MAKDYTILVLYLENGTSEAVDSVKKGLNILFELEKETGYHHLVIESFKQLKKSLDD